MRLLTTTLIIARPDKPEFNSFDWTLPEVLLWSSKWIPYREINMDPFWNKINSPKAADFVTNFLDGRAHTLSLRFSYVTKSRCSRVFHQEAKLNSTGLLHVAFPKPNWCMHTLLVFVWITTLLVNSWLTKLSQWRKKTALGLYKWPLTGYLRNIYSKKTWRLWNILINCMRFPSNVTTTESHHRYFPGNVKNYFKTAT